MKIEMGESLVYSWLRHVKKCHIVQTNWKASPNWELPNKKQIDELRAKCEAAFPETMNEAVFKKVKTRQILKQREIDALGISLGNNEHFAYAVDVAFHENGLKYKEGVVATVTKKSLQALMCLLGYGIAQSGEIIFASPKISVDDYNGLLHAIKQCNEVLRENHLKFTIRVIANGDFEKDILIPTQEVGRKESGKKKVSDTSELFLRSMQLHWMFGQDECDSKRPSKPGISGAGPEGRKIGKIARTIFRELLESGAIPPEEIERLQEADYSKTTLDLNHPCLLKAYEPFEKKERYYSPKPLFPPLGIHGQTYYLCSEWNETSRRPLLEYISKYR